jgi:hypothetical protein
MIGEEIHVKVTASQMRSEWRGTKGGHTSAGPYISWTPGFLRKANQANYPSASFGHRFRLRGGRSEATNSRYPSYILRVSR